MIEHKGYDRLVNFTDAVVAIAATILILPVADAASEVSRGGADAFIASVLPELMMFLLSFVLIANFWLEHHRLFRRIDKFNTPLLILNLLWILGIVIMPVPTALIVDGNAHDSLAFIFYVGTMLWISLMQLLLSNYVRQHPVLEHGGQTAQARTVGSLFSVIYLALAMVIGLIFPAVGLWALMLMLLIPVSVRITLNRRATKAA